jgi:hypothetical protein
MNPLHPSHMSTPERLAEIGEILAAGLIRLRLRQSSRLAADQGESSLHFPPDQSVHAPVLSSEECA